MTTHDFIEYGFEPEFIGRLPVRVVCEELDADDLFNIMVNRQLVPALLGGGNRFEYETEVLIIASRGGYRIESVPISTVYSDEVSKIHPLRDAIRFFNLMWRYRKPR